MPMPCPCLPTARAGAHALDPSQLVHSVCNIPSYSTDAMAQLVITGILNFSSGMVLQQRLLSRGDRSNFASLRLVHDHFELAGKTLGLIGGNGASKSSSRRSNSAGGSFSSWPLLLDGAARFHPLAFHPPMAVGRRVTEIATCLGMEVLWYSRSSPLSLDEMLGRSDFVRRGPRDVWLSYVTYERSHYPVGRMVWLTRRCLWPPAAFIAR
jgi:hypothetical protein